MTIPHNFTLDVKTERIYKEFQDLARKEHKTVSELIRKWIIRYVEGKNLKVVESPAVVLPIFEDPDLKLLTRRAINPYPKGSDKYSKWQVAYTN